MKTKSLLVGMLALVQATSFSGNEIDPEVEIQQARLGFSIEVGPGPYYYGPYDPYGPCYGPGGIYLGPGCPQYYYGPYRSYYYHGRRGRRHHRRRGGHHRRGRRHRRR